jgi:hypothetical protein
MRRPVRWFGILALSLALIPGQLSTADAGVIPWLYDAVFGPVGHYGYSGYGYGGYSHGASYRYPYAGSQVSYVMPASPVYYRQSNCGPTGCGPSGCSTASSCVVGYRPLFSTPGYCATGGCSTVVSGYRYAGSNCGTCSTVASANSTCDAKTAWKSKDAQTEWKAEVIRGESAVPTPVTKDDAPKPTFQTGPSDGQSVEKVVAEEQGGVTGGGKPAPVDPNWTSTGKPAAGVTVDVTPTGKASGADAGFVGKAADAASPTSAGFGETVREGDAAGTPAFSEPVQGVDAATTGGAVPTKTPVLPEGGESSPASEGTPASKLAPGLDINLPLDLENKTSWKVEVPVQRIAFRAGFGRATLARTSIDVNVDYVVPGATALRMVSR